jgi:large subunit ribosomal protein LP0
VYDNGSLFDAKVLDLTEEILLGKFGNAVKKVASLSMVLGQANLASLPHYMAHAFNNCVAVAIECVDVAFDQAAPYKSAVGVKPDKPAEEEKPAEEAAPAPAPAAASDY